MCVQQFGLCVLDVLTDLFLAHCTPRFVKWLPHCGCEGNPDTDEYRLFVSSWLHRWEQKREDLNSRVRVLRMVESMMDVPLPHLLENMSSHRSDQYLQSACCLVLGQWARDDEKCKTIGESGGGESVTLF